MSLPGFTAEAAVDDFEEEGGEAIRRARYRISLPGLASGEIGLGDVVARTASLVGLTPCGGCRRRAQALNSWLAFSSRR
jgi:hypothetical protein